MIYYGKTEGESTRGLKSVRKFYNFTGLEQAFKRIDEKKAEEAEETKYGLVTKEFHFPQDFLVNDSPMIIRHLRYRDEYLCPKAKGGITCGFIIDYNSWTMKVYPTICSDDENFNRNVGRYMVMERFQSDIYLTIPYNPGYTLSETVATWFANHWDPQDEGYNVEHNLMKKLNEVLSKVF